MPFLCSLCSQISFLDLPPFPDWLGGYHVPLSADSELLPFLPKRSEDESSGSVAPRALGLPHHPSLADLQVAAASCDVCKLIEQSVGRVRKILEEAQNNKHYVYYNKSGPPLYEFFMSKRREGEDGLLMWSMAEDNHEVFLLGAIGFCVDDDSPLKTHFRGRIVYEDPTSPTSFDRLRNWLKTCDNHHIRCCPDEVELPLRVIDVADPSLDSGIVKLIEPDGSRGKYATLSHCWGSSPKFTTTKSTLAARKLKIEITSLPETFQDAITVARELEIRYLWIDSLCICQDDGADWERESAKMASIYSNSYITIAASMAVDDSTGFLRPRPAREYVKLPMTLRSSITEANNPSESRDNSDKALKGTIHLFNIPINYAASGTAYIAHAHEPLTTRAWALQERYLAPRTLHFGSSQISFECLDAFETEDGYRSTVHLFSVDELPEPRQASRAHRGSERWYELLHQYSDRKLSRESDKLPALSGLARLFQQRYNDEYIAGLWKSQLIEGMCWQCFGGDHTRPKEYRAPSWSWASVDGMFSITRISGWRDLAEVVDVQVEVKGENPYGEVSSGSLELRAVLERLWVSEEPEPDEDKVPHRRYVRLRTEKGDSYGWYTSFDIKSESDRESVKARELYIVPLAARLGGGTSKDNNWVCYALVVALHTEGCYRREGFILLSDEKAIVKWNHLKENDELRKFILV